ncbi:uncharacterized protein EDB91DRAFT_1235444 [Suillus paluster]|uniref:uncharacterized protein n=1 Tax=Suillus paluster TaxID=48578 RepID=UPI001B869EF1|nr:uncharacterized protein EDB91DRAFT_1235444 [Suillus paluster]KAG1750032.1 hypothetical protein EDB91DRAFT_1235444 [Suillus paluster]
MRQGCIGASPIMPTVAITLHTLAVYCQTHCVCPRLSIHAEVKKLCHLHGVCYHRYLADQLWVAFDVYIEVQCHVDARVDSALGQDSPNWHMLNACPACHYEVEDEPAMPFSFQLSMDGNNSAKLVDPVLRRGNERPDPRDQHCYFWMSEEYVDRFKHEVCNARQQVSSPIEVPDSEQATETNDTWRILAHWSQSVCLDQWCNSAPEAQKQMFAVILLTICDMVRSGELMKYPLATIHRLMEVYQRPFIYGYNIKCMFDKIISRSSLSSTVHQLGVDGIVNGFHRHAHSCLCQVQHHCEYKVRAGKEDFETCECTFSESNAVAPEICNASKFHCHQVLDEHFRFSKLDKYAFLSTFIYHNYMQALDSIRTNEDFLHQFPMSPEDFEADLSDEHRYLRTATSKRKEDSVEIDYKLDFWIINDGYSRKEIADITRWRTNTSKKLSMQMDTVEAFENQMGLTEHWSPIDPRCAADDVERLVVMRLLELTKLQMSRLGYKLWTQISKALKTCANTIRNAIERYNKFAAQLDPLRPELTWEKIAEYSFTGKFNLLHETDKQIHAKRWASPANCQAAIQYFDVQRSKEELTRCNVEIVWLLTKMRDDKEDYAASISKLQSTDPPLAAELHHHWTYLCNVNTGHHSHIRQIQQLAGYTGNFIPEHQEIQDDGDDEPEEMADMQSALEAIFGCPDEISDEAQS